MRFFFYGYKADRACSHLLLFYVPSSDPKSTQQSHAFTVRRHAAKLNKQPQRKRNRRMRRGCRGFVARAPRGRRLKLRNRARASATGRRDAVHQRGADWEGVSPWSQETGYVIVIEQETEVCGR